jgi:hypothetical protein
MYWGAGYLVIGVEEQDGHDLHQILLLTMSIRIIS